MVPSFAAIPLNESLFDFGAVVDGVVAFEFVGCEVGQPGSKRFRRDGWLLAQGEGGDAADDEANRHKSPVCHRAKIAKFACKTHILRT